MDPTGLPHLIFAPIGRMIDPKTYHPPGVTMLRSPHDTRGRTVNARPPAGWGERNGRPTFTVHGSSWNVEPPGKEGWHPHFIARHGVEYTTWSYRPNAEECGCSQAWKDRVRPEQIDCRVCGSRVYRGAERCGGCGSPRPGIDGWAR